MTKRRAGWYWVKFGDDNDWECKRLVSNGHWASDDGVHEHAPSTIGDRIPTPDEPWQCVPKEPTKKMLDSAWDECGIGGRQDYIESYVAMLFAAPKPENI